MCDPLLLHRVDGVSDCDVTFSDSKLLHKSIVVTKLFTIFMVRVVMIII